MALGKKILIAFCGLVLVAVVVLLLTPSPIDPAAYQPPPAPELTGRLAPNHDLLAAELFAVGRLHGPEDVAVDADGRMYGGTEDGRIVRIDPGDPDTEPEIWAEDLGRPLGLEFDAAGRLIVADGKLGLLAVTPTRTEVLSDRAAGNVFGFTDDLDIASDGRIYFSDASSRFGPEEYLYDLLEARPHGRLLRHDPATGETEVLLDGLYFANGIALSRDEDFVLVNETYRYRVTRYWLEGPEAGTSDVFLDNLPGFPDGVSSNGQGTFWLALFTVRNPLMDRLHPRPFFKSLLAKLPRFLWPKPAPYGLVLAVDEDGRLLRSLHDPTGEHVRQVTSVEEEGGFLHFGHLTLDRISRLAL